MPKHAPRRANVRDIVRAGKAGWRVGKYLGGKLRNYMDSKQTVAKRQKLGKRSNAGFVKSSTKKGPRHAMYSSSDTKCFHNFEDKSSLKKEGKLIKTLPSQKLLYNGAAALSAVGANSQGALDICNMVQGNLQELFTIAVNQELNNLFLANYNGYYVNQKLYVEHAYTTYHYVNSSIYTAKVTLYDYVVRRDTATTAAAMLSGFAASPDASGKSTTLANVVTSVFSTPGFTPLDSSAFNTHYRITKTTQLTLAPGETHTHKVFAKYNKHFNADLTTGGPDRFRGYSHGVLAIVYGQPGEYSGQAGTTTMPVSLRCFEITRTKFKLMTFQKPHLETITNINNPAGNPIIIDEQIGELIQAGVGVGTSGNA